LFGLKKSKILDCPSRSEASQGAGGADSISSGFFIEKMERAAWTGDNPTA